MSWLDVLKIVIAAVCAGLFGSMGVFLLTIVRERYRDSRDKKIVYKAMTRMHEESKTVFISPIAISARVDLTPSRVSHLCSIHPEIKPMLDTNVEKWRRSIDQPPKRTFKATVL